MDFNSPKFFLPNFLRSLFAKVFTINIFYYTVKLDIHISNVHVSKLITGRGIMNWMLGCSSIAYSQCLLEEEGKLLPAKDSAIVNTSSIQ